MHPLLEEPVQSEGGPGGVGTAGGGGCSPVAGPLPDFSVVVKTAC